MLKTIQVIAFVFVALFLYGKYGPGLPVTSVITQKQDLFTVSGEGKVTVVPDTGIVNLGVSVSKPTVKAAQDLANSVINNITSEIKKLGVDSKDIKTTNYSIFPQYDFKNGNTITGYQINLNLTVKVRELDKINQVIDSATAQGANSIGGIELTVDDKRQKELLREARNLAVLEAKEKAESLAQSAGITLGKIVNVVESGNPKGEFLIKRDFSEAGMGGGTPTSINPGSSDISSTVTLFYETR